MAKELIKCFSKQHLELPSVEENLETLLKIQQQEGLKLAIMDQLFHISPVYWQEPISTYQELHDLTHIGDMVKFEDWLSRCKESLGEDFVKDPTDDMLENLRKIAFDEHNSTVRYIQIEWQLKLAARIVRQIMTRDKMRLFLAIESGHGKTFIIYLVAIGLTMMFKPYFEKNLDSKVVVVHLNSFLLNQTKSYNPMTQTDLILHVTLEEL